MAASARPAVSKPPSRRARILIVEDEALIAMDLERRLSRAGYEVTGTADNCEDALSLFRETQPSLVLMDITIRGPLDGIETARLIGRESDVPVVFLTAFADDDTVARAAQITPYGYLLKPFDDRALGAMLTVVLERHAADTRLRVLEAAVTSATVGILLVEAMDEHRRITLVNETFLAMSGVPREKILGQRPCFLAGDSDDAAVRRLRDAVTSRSQARETIHVKRANGERFWSTVTISPVANRAGRVTHLLVFHEDISGEREAQDALAVSQRLEVVGRLSAGIAHDFNNVLAAIAAFTDLARDSVEDPLARGDLDEIQQATKRGSLLTRKLLQFSRSGHSGAAVANAAAHAAAGGAPQGSADLNRVVRDTWQMASRLAGPGVQLELQLASGPMFVSLDTTSLEQILLNLVVNARDAMPGGGKIRVAVTEREDGGANGRGSVCLSVTDTGTGMSPEIADRIFSPFFTTKTTGTGLGLATCQMLVERAGGAIRVESTLGQGTTFTLDFPLDVQTTTATAADEAVDGLVGRAAGAICLVVEDDEPVRRAAARVLKSVGFEVTEVASGEVACRELDRLGRSLRLLVCDMVLPGIPCADVLAHAHKTAPKAESIILAGHVDPAFETLVEGASMLWKPFRGGALARRALDMIGAELGMEAQPASKRSSIVARAPRRVDPKSPLVLLIEDDEQLRDSLGAVLESRGHRVAHARTGAQGLAALTEHDVGSVVLDVNLPDADGIEILRSIRARDPLLPTIVMTGEASLETAQRALQGRVAAFLTKPVAPGIFVEEVERALTEGQVARLQHKLLMSKSGAMVTDLAATRSRFDESLANLFTAYQPIVRTYDKSIFAFEALMRSKGPFTSPGDILEAAEALGRLEDVGRAVRSSIATTLAEHPERFEPIFVNLHPMELRTELLLADDEALLPFASRIVFEVTERAQLSSAQDLTEILRALRRAGYRVALDDLGEGYAGLSCLVRMTPDVAKIDMSLVRDIDRLRLKRELVSSLVGVCRRAKTLVVAEGVETEAEAAILREIGCDLLQGYFFARPGPPFPDVR